MREYSAAVPFIQGERADIALQKDISNWWDCRIERAPHAFRFICRHGGAARHGTFKSCLLLVLALIPTGGHTEPIETEHMFGFTIGSDTGDVGNERSRGP